MGLQTASCYTHQIHPQPASSGGQDRRVTMVREVFDMTWENLELARGIEPPTCGLQISDRGLLKSLKTWQFPLSSMEYATSL